jgi:cell division protease FtsH
MRATDIARAMVTQFGLSDALGLVSYEGQRAPAFLEGSAGYDRGNYAEATALEIDAEIKRIVTEAHEKALDLLRTHRDVLDRLSERLLEKEVIEADELKTIMGPPPAKDPDTIPADIPPVG